MTTAHDDNGHRDAAHARIEGQARAWVVRLTSGSATKADAEECAAWRADPEHDAAFLAAARLWQLTGRAFDGGAAVTGRQTSARPTRRHVLRRAAWGVGAGSIAAGCGAVALRWPELSATYRTGTGELRTIILADGTRLELDAETSLDEGGADRRPVLRLHTGAVAVTATDGVPVTVQAAGMRATTSGSAGELAVSCRPAPDAAGWFGGRVVTVSCLAGGVEVRESDAAASTLLRAGYSIAVGRGPAAPHPLDNATTAWRRGLLVFRDTPLATVVDDLNRYRPGRIVLAGSVAASRRVTGVFHLDRPDEALTSIRTALGLAEYRLGERLILLR
jgi:transmembrane sensor